MLNYTLYNSDQVYALISKNHSKIHQVCALIRTNHSKINNLTKYLITINSVNKSLFFKNFSRGALGTPPPLEGGGDPLLHLPPFGAMRLSETHGFISVPTHHNSPSYAPEYSLFVCLCLRGVCVCSIVNHFLPLFRD